MFFFAAIFLVVLYKLYDYLKSKPFQIDGAIVVITGTGNGLGRKLCFEFAKKDCQIICIDINETNNHETIKEVKLKYPECKIKSYICDVSKYESVKQVVQDILNEYIHIDILINNAGIVYSGELEDFSELQIRNIMDLNVLANFWTTKEILPSMKKRDRGFIVAVSSLGGIVGVKHINPYCASKFAVTGFMESLKNELRASKSNIQTLSVHPNFMKTQMINQNMYNNKLLFLVEPTHVAKEILAGIENGKTQIFIPFYLWHLVKVGRIFPFILHYILDNIVSVRRLIAFKCKDN